MAGNPPPEFGKRRPVAPRPSQPSPPVKRSHHVVLLLMGTFAVGSAAYALMPRDNCRPGMASPTGAQGAECQPRSSSSGGGHGNFGSSSRSGFFGGDNSSGSSSAVTAESGSGVRRGGFGSFFAAHFSGGG